MADCRWKCKSVLHIITLCLVSLILSGCVSLVDCFRNGNIPSNACDSMMPGHGVDPQAGPSPYSITFNPASYTPGSTVSVTITGSEPFKGFLIAAKRASALESTDRFGSFTVVSGTRSSCSGVLSHDNNNDKTTLTFDWTAPSVSEGDLIFKATFVESQPVIYTNVMSATLQGPQNVVQVSPDCGNSKGCFSQCPSMNCDFTISWSEDGNYGVYNLTTQTNFVRPWMAVAFSGDALMGNDSVSGCKTEDDGNIVIFNAENPARSGGAQQRPIEFMDQDVSLTNSEFQDGIFTCTIRRLKMASSNGKRFDITQNHTLLFARGLTTGSVIGYHNASDRFFSPSQFSVSDTPNIGAPTDSTTPAPPLGGSVALPTDCGLSRGCFAKCAGTNCEFIVSWIPSGNDGVYTLSASTVSSTPWIAMAWSADDQMGGDSVIGCGADSNANVVLFSAENTGRTTPSQFSDNEVTLEDSSFADGILSCRFRRPRAASANGKRFDINQNFFILFAMGPAVISGQTLTQNYHVDDKYISSAAYSVTDTPNDGASDLEFPLVKVHGSLMIGAWIFFASIGIVVARYFKPVWTTDLCSTKAWFQIHRTCMVLVFLVTVAGFIVIFVEVEGWSELMEPDSYLDAHPIMGVVVTALTVLNPLMALIRPHPGTKNRPYFNWAHWFVGTSAHILGVITIFFGVQLTRADGPEYLVYILAGYVGWQVLVELTLELLQCCGREEHRSNAYEMGDVTKPVVTTQESQGTLSTKRVILAVHIFVVASITAVLIGFIAVGERELEG